MHAKSVAEFGAGCSGFVCDNAKLRSFIGERLDASDKKAYEEKVADAREVSIKDAQKGQRLKKETRSSEDTSSPVTSYLLPAGVALVVIILILFLIAKRRKGKE